MKKSSGLVIGLLTLVAIAGAQETPVTINEADLSFKKAYGHLQQVLSTPAAKFTVSSSKEVFTRDQFISRLTGMYDYLKPKIQPRFKPVAVDVKKMAPGLTRERQKQLTILMSFGLVSKDSYLYTGTKTRYSPREFGKILGSFLSRALELTHALDPKYSPELMGPGKRS